MFAAGRRLGLLLAAAGMLLGVVACSGGGNQPTTLPPVTATTPAADATSAPTHHTRADDLAAVKAVVREYYGLLGAPTTTKTADRIAKLVYTGCKCASAVASFRAAARAHEQYFGEIRIRSLVANLDGRDSAEALAVYDYTRAGLEADDGRIIHSQPAHAGVRVVLRLTRASGAWRIDVIELLSSGSA